MSQENRIYGGVNFVNFHQRTSDFFHLIFIELLLDVIQSVYATRMTCCDVVCSSLHDDTTHTGQELLWDRMSPMNRT